MYKPFEFQVGWFEVRNVHDGVQEFVCQCRPEMADVICAALNAAEHRVEPTREGGGTLPAVTPPNQIYVSE